MAQQQELARHLAQEGGTLILLGMPPGTEFGIDVNFWNVGERFRGVKMIPPGLHFIYFSAVSLQGDTAPRTGFFHVFGAREVLVKHYDQTAEDLVNEEPSVEEVERIRSNLREMDRFLGPYPLESWQKWISLTQHVDEAELRRMVPLSGRVCSAAELTPVAGFRSSKTQRYTATTASTDTDAQNTPTDTAHPTETNTAPSSQTKEHITHPDINTPTPQPPTASVHIPDTPMDTAHPTDTPTDTAQTTETNTALSSQTKGHISHPDTNTPILQPRPDTTVHGHIPDTPTDTAHPRIPPQLPEMVQKEGTMFRFTQPPQKGYREGASPSEVTKYSLDSSYSVRTMLAQVKGPGSLVAELQVSFVTFLVGQVWDAWEHWRTLLGELCRAEEILLQHPQMYSTIMSVLHYQVAEIPEDLFVDIVESNNFLASALTTLFANIHDNASTLPPALVLKARRFKDHLTAKFEWDLTLGDEGEFAPVLVDT